MTRRLLLVALLLACGDVGQRPVSLPLQARGQDPGDGLALVGDYLLVPSQAELAFGPLYLCPAVSAGDLCETARLQWHGSAVIDLLDESPQELGSLEGLTGSVRSYMYDLGLSSQLGQAKPLVLEAARRLGGHSMRFAGRVLSPRGEIPFSFTLDAAQSTETEAGAPIVRRTLRARSQQEVNGDERLELTFEGIEALASLDLRPYLQDENCTEHASEWICAGNTAQLCGEQGPSGMEIACGERNEFCVNGAGCQPGLVLDKDSKTFRDIYNGFVVNGGPEFRWLDE